jgi:hypothetical protein
VMHLDHLHRLHVLHLLHLAHAAGQRGPPCQAEWGHGPGQASHWATFCG